MADGSVVIEILGDAAKFNAALSKVERAVDSTVGAAGRSLSRAGDAMTVAITTPMTVGATAAAKWAAGVVGAAEQADIALSTMLGPERARELLEELADFARKTPFEMSGLTSATQKLLAYGFAAEDVVPLLTAVGDATSGLGAGQEGIDSVTRALGQMQAKGKVMSEEMLQLTEVGIPAWQYLADVVSDGDIPTAMEMVTAGAVDADTAIAALRAGMEGDFGGMMAEQASTLQGVLSNLSDAIESPLRKLKDTKGWADLTEALSRLSESAGPLVERALPVLDDLLSDLAGVVTDVAGALDGLDTSDLAGIADAAIALAGAGPMMSVAGRGLQAISKGVSVAGGAARTGASLLGKLSDKVLDLATSPKTANTALGTLSGALAAIPGPAKAAALVVGTVLVACFADAAARAEELREHEELMAGVTMSASEIMGDAAASADGLGGSLDGVRSDAEGTLESIRDLNESVGETFSDLAVDSGMLDQYVATIEELANKSGLSATEQERLKEAVEGYNSVTGESYSVVDAANGKIADQSGVVQENTDQILENARAWEARARSEAFSTVAADYMAKEVESAYELELATDDLNRAREREAELLDIVNDTSKAGTREQAEAVDELGRLQGTIGDLEQDVSDLTEAHDAMAESADYMSSRAALEASAFQLLGDGSESFVEALAASGVSLSDFAALSDEELAAIAAAWDGTTEGISSAITNAGVSVGSFSGILASASPEVQASAATMAQAMGTSLSQLEADLANAGVSSEQMGAVSSEAFAGMVARCGGDITTLAWMIQNYNSVPVADKSGKITINDSQLRDASGNVYTWNGEELVDQDGVAAVDDVELLDAQGNLYTWNGSELEDKRAAADVDTSGLQSGIDLLNAWNAMRAENKTATFTTTNRTINVTETQTVQRSAPAASRAAAAPAALSAGPAAEGAGARLSAVAARLSTPLPAALMATASDALSLAASRAVEERAARAAVRAVEVELSGTPAWAERLERTVERSAERLGDAISSPARVMWDMRELGRLVKEAEGA